MRVVLCCVRLHEPLIYRVPDNGSSADECPLARSPLLICTCHGFLEPGEDDRDMWGNIFVVMLAVGTIGVSTDLPPQSPISFTSTQLPICPAPYPRPS
jgi:hypothetical protein